MVVVHDAYEVVEAVLTGAHGGFPDLAFLYLAVAHGAEDTVAHAVLLAGESHADGVGEPLAQGACGHVNAGDVVHLGVAGEVAVHLAEGLEVLDGEEAPEGEGGVERGGAVALGENEAVAFRGPGVCGVEIFHGVEVEDREYVRDGEGPADMS